ncbi:hypothetical protein CDEST_02718 [Colletotrichum destructivum]|uniref:Uncharacterized protein n=1 Tax=Colletotrichum destructivum TaxID=34406 RepID=A0AAX4I2W0_9PEZI|nr:hypothetical protein CDEST_02718 [Colletotrichum destructivum]
MCQVAIGVHQRLCPLPSSTTYQGLGALIDINERNPKLPITGVRHEGYYRTTAEQSYLAAQCANVLVPREPGDAHVRNPAGTSPDGTFSTVGGTVFPAFHRPISRIGALTKPPYFHGPRIVSLPGMKRQDLTRPVSGSERVDGEH